MKKPNIFWVLTDSLRPYYSKDKFSKIPIYDELRKEGVLFENVVASASSTAMSLSSILKGQWAIYLAHHFDSFKKIDSHNYIDVFKKNNYKVSSSICFSGGVNFFGNLFNPYERKNPKKFFPGSAQLTTKQSYENFLKVMKKDFDPSKPNFVFVHFRAGDLEHDKYLRKIFEYLKQNNLFEKSIFVASSDHGFFDPKLHKKRELLHYDGITEESIKAIQFIHFPEQLSSVKNRVVKDQISTIDLFETICDYLSFKHNFKDIDAISFKPLLEKNTSFIRKKFNNRIIRSDTRYLLQLVGKTSIKNNDYKLIYDRKNFEFFDLKKDPLEEKSVFHLASYKTKISRFKKELFLTNKKVEEKTLQSLKEVYSKSVLKDFEGEKILLYDFIHPLILSFLYKKLSFNNEVLIVSKKDLKALKKGSKAKVLFFPVNYFQTGFHEVMSLCSKKKIDFYLFNQVFEEVSPSNFFSLVWEQVKITRKKFFQRPFYFAAFIYRLLNDYKTIRDVSKIYKEKNQKFNTDLLHSK